MLFRLLYHAIKGTNDSIVQNIIGINDDDDQNSKLNIQDIYKLLKKLLFIKLPFHKPSFLPDFIGNFFFGDNSRYIEDSLTKSKNTSRCIYINGILTDFKTIESHKKKLKEVFPYLPPIDCFYNATDNFISDIFECIINKQTDNHSEASQKLFNNIVRLLVDPSINNIIIIAHSQGTILISFILLKLKEIGLDKKIYMEKLQIFLFSNCSTSTKYVLPEKKLPYIESLSNEHDFVSKLGMTSSCIDFIDIDGEQIIFKKRYGHLFIKNYLCNLNDTHEFKKSKLYHYYKQDYTQMKQFDPFDSYFS